MSTTKDWREAPEIATLIRARRVAEDKAKLVADWRLLVREARSPHYRSVPLDELPEIEGEREALLVRLDALYDETNAAYDLLDDQLHGLEHIHGECTCERLASPTTRAVTS